MARVRVEVDYDGLGRIYLEILESTERIGDDIVTTMRRLVPVDTGELRSTIDGLMVDDTYLAVVGTDYWQFVEYGTSKMAAQPFIRPALYRSR